MTIQLFSKGLCSSWCFHRPTRTLFDCGEYVGTYLHNDLYAIERICIGHGDLDHTAGLLGLLGVRNNARGDRTKPLTVYYPESALLNGLIDYIKQRNADWLRYEVTWTPIQAGFEIPLSDKQFIRAFEVQHNRGRLCLGYSVMEKRQRLTEQAKTYIADIPAALKAGFITRETMNEPYCANIFSYILDNFKTNPQDIKDTALLVADATFLDGTDRTDDTHMTIQEATALAVEAGAKKVLFAHISPRYNLERIEDLKRGFNPPFEYQLITGNRVWEI
jgi:ribonuclease Z